MQKVGNLLLILHRREEQHFANVVLLGEEHGEAVDAKPMPPAGGMP
jgi:hypothetical protein